MIWSANGRGAPLCFVDAVASQCGSTAARCSCVLKRSRKDERADGKKMKEEKKASKNECQFLLWRDTQDSC